MKYLIIAVLLYVVYQMMKGNNILAPLQKVIPQLNPDDGTTPYVPAVTPSPVAGTSDASAAISNIVSAYVEPAVAGIVDFTKPASPSGSVVLKTSPVIQPVTVKRPVPTGAQITPFATIQKMLSIPTGIPAGKNPLSLNY